ncbi:MAG: endonuclease/exonuclease/phosphatase family protein [Deltaproteobacteria bacterium]|nr:endonuclease/exonuclease/phosphatase family protein [Deltaproteobacteria bacterium]
MRPPTIRPLLVALLLSLPCCAERSPLVTDGGEADGRPDTSRPDIGELGGPQGFGDAERPRIDVPSGDAGADPGPELPTGPAPPVTVATWNLRDFSPYGAQESRLDHIAQQLAALDADIIGVQELEAREGSDGSPPQAWDALLDRLPAYEGVHAPWNLQDSVVGLLVRRDTVRVLAAKPIFVGDWWPFPRAPLDATLSVEKPEGTVLLHVVVIHLKAFGDSESLSRRREACTKLAGALGGRGDARYVLVGDFNDSPHDPAPESAFVGTLLGVEPVWTFVTAALPPTTVSSTGGSHEVDGQVIEGGLLDQIVVDETVTDLYPAPVAEVIARPVAEYDAWRAGWSDHFPVILHLTP